MSTLLQAANDVSLKNKSRFFFSLTILLTLIAALGILYECVSCTGSARIPGSVFIVLTLLLCTQLAAMIYVERNIIQPLMHISSATRLMADGHLETLSQLKRSDEIGRLSENINDLAINMQEVLLYAWNHSRESRELLEAISGQLDLSRSTQNPLNGIRKDILTMRRNNEDLKSIVLSFSYFEIKLEHEKMLADYEQENRAAKF